MLEVLKDAGGKEVASNVLATAADVEVRQVLSILKHSIAVGRVAYRLEKERRIGWYCLRTEFDDEVHEQLMQAASLLRRHGWEVKRP